MPATNKVSPSVHHSPTRVPGAQPTFDQLISDWSWVDAAPPATTWDRSCFKDAKDAGHMLHVYVRSIAALKKKMGMGEGEQEAWEAWLASFRRGGANAQHKLLHVVDKSFDGYMHYQSGEKI